MNIILQALYFMLPAYIANMVPLFGEKFPIGARPISKRLFGDHKTYRGFIIGVVAAFLVLLIQKYISGSMKAYEILYYDALSYKEIALYALTLGGGALVGDLIKSFFKRRIGIAPGAPWVPLDQLDFVFGSLALTSFLYIPPYPHLVVIIILTPFLHLLANMVAYLLNIKKVWW